ncbi:MAG TPA: SGNH/GDSL hydrolase family protein [Burkholderiaceae bacterium]|jgi:lysophospholipase L1-like esterase|nr:SGNH/GDSL hydrolase family protein [Burkholderiaceae bacterium]
MTRYSAQQLRDGAVSFFGAFDFDERPAGISPRRLPAWTRAQIPKALDDILRMPSGVRMAFSTDSRELRLFVQTTRMVTPPQAPRPVVFDLVIDAVTVRSAACEGGNTVMLNRADPARFELIRGDAYEVVFAGLPAGDKRCELWLPHNAYVEIRGLEIDDGAALSALPAPAQRRWIHYGSSISHCMEADQPTGTWPAVAARLAGMHLHSLGFGGQCHLDPFVARTIRDADADLITLKTGINVINADSMRERVFGPAVHGFLDTIRERRPDTPIVLVSPIFCPSAEHRPGPTMPDVSGKYVTLSGHEAIQTGCLTLTRVREVLAEVVDVRRRAGDRQLHYLNGLQLFGAADAADLPDDLHPNPAGYARMGERFVREVLTGGLALG